MIHGSCLCGQVRFELDTARVINHCHCSMCRKVHGAAFGSFLHGDGALDDDPIVRPGVHIHTASKAPWYEIADALPQFAEYPPDAFWSEHER